MSRLITRASTWYLVRRQASCMFFPLIHCLSYNHCCILEFFFFLFFFFNYHKIKPPKGHRQGSLFQRSIDPISSESCFSGKRPHSSLLLPLFKIYHHTLGTHNCPVGVPIGWMVWVLTQTSHCCPDPPSTSLPFSHSYHSETHSIVHTNTDLACWFALGSHSTNLPLTDIELVHFFLQPFEVTNLSCNTCIFVELMHQKITG